MYGKSKKVDGKQQQKIINESVKNSKESLKNTGKDIKSK